MTPPAQVLDQAVSFVIVSFEGFGDLATQASSVWAQVPTSHNDHSQVEGEPKGTCKGVRDAQLMESTCLSRHVPGVMAWAIAGCHVPLPA